MQNPASSENEDTPQPICLEQRIEHLFSHKQVVSMPIPLLNSVSPTLLKYIHFVERDPINLYKFLDEHPMLLNTKTLNCLEDNLRFLVQLYSENIENYMYSRDWHLNNPRVSKKLKTESPIVPDPVPTGHFPDFLDSKKTGLYPSQSNGDQDFSANRNPSPALNQPTPEAQTTLKNLHIEENLPKPFLFQESPNSSYSKDELSPSQKIEDTGKEQGAAAFKPLQSFLMLIHFKFKILELVLKHGLRSIFEVSMCSNPPDSIVMSLQRELIFFREKLNNLWKSSFQSSESHERD